MSDQLSFLAEPEPITYRKPGEPIVRTALIEGNYRRWLMRRWGPGPSVFWGMHNPSDASASRDDPTLWSIMGFSFRWGFGGLVVGNVYPIITSSPQACRRWRASIDDEKVDPDRTGREAWIRNAYDCAELLKKCDLHMAAWGNGVDPDDLALWLEMITGESGIKPEWHCLGTNADGSPKHPLARGKHRTPADQKAIRWGSA